jgi:hypothetical protein
MGIGSFLLYCFFAGSALDLQADAGEEGAWGGGEPKTKETSH